MLYDGINHRFHIKERKALILIPAILSLVSGMVISVPYEAFAQPANTITGSGSQMITQEQAIQVAITNQSVRTTDVGETELDDENDRTVYKVDIVKGNQELEVNVDALTGEVVNVEAD
jgi:uncharacterized membrane protein YkoI